MEAPSPPITPYILLSLLLLQKLSGSALQQYTLQAQQDFLTPSQIDAGIRELSHQGLVTLSEADAAGEPVYAITPRGENVLQRWLVRMPVADDGATPVPLGHIPGGHLVPPHTLITLLEAHQRQCREALATCEAEVNALPLALTGTGADERTQFPSLVLQLRIAELRADLAWAEQGLGRLRPRDQAQGSV